MKNVARNHHFVPQGYLAAFTDDESRNGRLFVADLVSHSVFSTSPANVAVRRDFNRIDAPGHDPNGLERTFADLEGKAIRAIRFIRTSGTWPSDEAFTDVMLLMALLVVRNPLMRRNMNAARRQTIRIIEDLLASDRRLFEHHVALAKKDGCVTNDESVSFEQFRQSVCSEGYRIDIPPGASLMIEMGALDSTVRSLGSRYWSIVTAAPDAPNFATCDLPVVLSSRDRRGRPIGYGSPRTEVSFALGPRHLLLGVLEDSLQQQFSARPDQVAAINSRTVYHADRQVYSKTDDVTVLGKNGVTTLDLCGLTSACTRRRRARS